MLYTYMYIMVCIHGNMKCDKVSYLMFFELAELGEELRRPNHSIVRDIAYILGMPLYILTLEETPKLLR